MCGSVFIQICAVGSKRRIFSAPDCVLAVQGRSGSSKVDDFGTNRRMTLNDLECPIHLKVRLVDGMLDVRLLRVSDWIIRIGVAIGGGGGVCWRA